MNPNKHPKTGISYGYIAARSLDNELVHDLMYSSQAVDLSYEEAREEYLRERQSETPEFVDFEELAEGYMQDFADSYECYEPIIEGEIDGVKYRTSWLGGALHFWIFESPHVGHFQQCSPCVPGAANLDQPCEDGIKGYDVPADWRYPDMGMPQT